MGAVIEQIWSLPWYKVLCVAVIDDVILLLKLWPLWLALLGVGIFGLWIWLKDSDVE